MCAASVILRRFRGGGGTCPPLLGLGGDAGGEGRGPGVRIPQRAPYLRAGLSSDHAAAQRLASRKQDTARNPWNQHPCGPTAPRGCHPRYRLPQEALLAASLQPAALIIHEPRNPTQRGRAAPGPSRSGRPGRPQVSDPKPHREGGVRAAPARWPSVGGARAPSRGQCRHNLQRGPLAIRRRGLGGRGPRTLQACGQRGLRTPATRPGPQDLRQRLCVAVLPQPQLGTPLQLRVDCAPGMRGRPQNLGPPRRLRSPHPHPVGSLAATCHPDKPLGSLPGGSVRHRMPAPLANVTEGGAPARVQMGLWMSAGRRIELPTLSPPWLTGSLDSTVHPILPSAPTAPGAANAWEEGPGETAPAEVSELGAHSPPSPGAGLEALREACAPHRGDSTAARLWPRGSAHPGAPRSPAASLARPTALSPLGVPHLLPPLCYGRPEGSS